MCEDPVALKHKSRHFRPQGEMHPVLFNVLTEKQI